MSFKSFIPNKISNRRVVGVWDLLSRVGRLLHTGRRRSDKHFEANRTAIKSLAAQYAEMSRAVNVKARQGFIESQNSMAHIAFGKSDMAYAGCEVIALYNALLELGQSVELSELIRHFERDGAALGGRFGTSPLALADYIEKRGFKASISYDPEGFCELADNSEVCIFTFYNDRNNIMDKIHTVCITRSDGGYIAHNVYGNGRIIGPAADITGLMDMINRGCAGGIMLIGICRVNGATGGVTGDGSF